MVTGGVGACQPFLASVASGVRRSRVVVRGDGVVVRRDGVEVRLLGSPTDAAAALAFLDRAGAAVDAPLVDESEQARLRDRAAGGTAGDHRAALARRGGEAVGYVGVVVGRGIARADVAVPGGAAARGPLAACLEASVALGRSAGADRLELWLRRPDEAAIERATAAGLALERRLAVLGRRLAERPATVPPPPGVAIRAYHPGDDDRAVVAVLAAAYADTAEADWDLAALAARRRYGWFAAEDLLLAVEEGEILGLHWTKRRSPTVGEVYNLAIAPAAQGRHLGVALLTAGLAHLHDAGIGDVILWVDRANERAVGLYTSQGFTVRWEDVALTRELR